MGCGHGSWGLPECSGQGADILLFSDDVHAQMECAQRGPSLRPRDCTCMHSLQQENSQFVLTGRYALLSMQRRPYCAVSRSGLATRGSNSMTLQGMRSNKVSKSIKEQSQSSQSGRVVPMSCSPANPHSLLHFTEAKSATQMLVFDKKRAADLQRSAPKLVLA